MCKVGRTWEPRYDLRTPVCRNYCTHEGDLSREANLPSPAARLHGHAHTHTHAWSSRLRRGPPARRQSCLRDPKPSRELYGIPLDASCSGVLVVRPTFAALQTPRSLWPRLRTRTTGSSSTVSMTVDPGPAARDRTSRLEAAAMTCL